MATKKRNETEEQRDENTAPEQSPENASPGGESMAPSVYPAPEEEANGRRTPGNKEDAAPCRNLDELALKRRVPTWQQAALARFMGWEDGKMLTEAEYDAALDQLATRRLGGGQNLTGGRNM